MHVRKVDVFSRYDQSRITSQSRLDICLNNALVIRTSDRNRGDAGRSMSSESERVTIRLPPDKVKALHQLVKSGDSVSVEDAVRNAVREYVRRRLHKAMEGVEK